MPENILPEHFILKLAEADAKIGVCKLVIQCQMLYGEAFYGLVENRKAKQELYSNQCGAPRTDAAPTT